MDVGVVSRDDADGRDTLVAAGPAEADTVADQSRAQAGGEQSLERGATLGRYVVLHRLGGGGMGVVYTAYDPELDRRVAVKLLRPDAASGVTASEGRTRLLREAQALARLSHPNVVAVHDAGTFGEQVFIAMEFVDGPTLGEWVRAKARTWREIVEAFVAAGRGLAAAHAAGIVHRDFKPSNALVGKDGRVRVADFGLAREAGSQPTQPATPDDQRAATEISSRDALATPLTRTGSLVGTPAYMAPEQLFGRATDARSDQFSFCVALYEALYGERPFGGDSVVDLTSNIVEGKIRPAPKDSRVPAWLREIVVRGLRSLPDQRYASMDTLLAALARDPAATRRRLVVLGGAIVVVAAGLALVGVRSLSRGTGASLCSGGTERLAGVWDDARKRDVHSAFAATKAPYAEDAFHAAAGALDGFRASWVKMYVDACEATRRRGVQSEELLDLRMRCLDDRLREARAAVDVLSTADQGVVAHASQVVLSLGVDRCADVAALQAPVRVPADPRVRGEVEAVRGELARAKALTGAGRFKDALAAVAPLVARAQATHYRPVEAEALYQHASLLEYTGDIAAAEKTYRDAFLAASAGRHDEMAAKSAIDLVWVFAVDKARPADAREWARQADAVLERLGSSADRMRSTLEGYVGQIASSEGKYEEALAHQQRAFAIWQRAGGDDKGTATSMADLCLAYYYLHKWAEAQSWCEKSLALREKVLGPHHPETAASLNNLGELLFEQGKYEEALVRHQRALEIRQAALGPRHPETSMSLSNISNVRAMQGKFDEAIKLAQEALDIMIAAHGEAHPDVALAEQNLGELMLERGRAREALGLEQRAVDAYEKSVGKDTPALAESLTAIGKSQLALGSPRLALAPLERALALREKNPGAVGEPATRFALARALGLTGGDRPRARKLATQARETYAADEKRNKKELGEVDAWLAKHP
jgi:tetratricopeptide (TPR) repeat protein/predicted Ser/Thr protein kinase